MIQADPATNSLIITAPEPLYRNIRQIIDKLDVRRAQVVIESLIAEVSAEKAAEFGIQWQSLGNINDSGTNVIGGTNFGVGGQNIIDAAQNIGAVRQGLNIGIVRGKVNIPGIGEILNLGFLARALETKADANILSTPTIQTLDNEEAKFLVGQNIPLITGSYANTGAGGTAAGVNPFQTFERRDIGLQLRVRPQISEGGVVRLADLPGAVVDPEHADGGAGRHHHQQAQLRVDGAGRGRQHRRARRPDRGQDRQQQEPGAHPRQHSVHRRTVQVREPQADQDQPARVPAAVRRAGRGDLVGAGDGPLRRTSAARSPTARSPTTSSSATCRAARFRSGRRLRRR